MAMLHRSPVGPERNGPLSLPSSRSRWMSLLRAECQAAKLSNFWVTREIIEEKERKTHRSRAQRHVCVLPPSTTSMCALSLECQPCHRFAFRNCLPPPSLSLRLPGVHREDFVTAGGQVVALSLSTPPRPTTTKKREGEIHTKVDDFDRPNRLSPLSQCGQGAPTGKLDLPVPHPAPSHDRTGPSCTSL